MTEPHVGAAAARPRPWLRQRLTYANGFVAAGVEKCWSPRLHRLWRERVDRVPAPSRCMTGPSPRGRRAHRLEAGRVGRNTKARQLRQKGISASDIAKMLGVSRATVYRYLSVEPAATPDADGASAM